MPSSWQLQRFVARQGKPFELLSDQCTNFRGGEQELKEAFASPQPVLQAQLAPHQIKFSFNPPNGANLLFYLVSVLGLCLESHSCALYSKMTRLSIFSYGLPVYNSSRELGGRALRREVWIDLRRNCDSNPLSAACSVHITVTITLL